jgi:polysaccharide biosynthesis/export protein
MNPRLLAATGFCLCLTGLASAQEPAQEPSSPNTTAREATSSAAIVRDPRTVDYVIGPEDVLDIMVWKNPELSRTVPVRPDGKVSLPLVNDIQAAGLTPSDLRAQVTEKLTDYVPSPEVAVIVREVHSVKVAVIGSVKLPGRYEIKTPATVLEMIAMAQGLSEFADKGGIVVLRQNGATTQRIPFNYRKVAGGSDQENFFVRPGDIIVVP